MVICGTNLSSSLIPYVHILSSSSNSCSQCFITHEDLKRCSKCHRVSYCSISCQRKDWIYHKHECSILDQLIDEYDLTRLFLRLCLRYKNDQGIENSSTKRSVNDLQMHENDIRSDKRRLRTFQSIFERFKQWNLLDQFDPTIVFELFCRLVINTLTIHEPIDLKPIGYGLYLDATIYNHSCFPTCHTLFNGIVLTIRTICEQSNDEWTINYTDLLEPYSIRQEFLREHYYFTCQCKRCLNSNPQEIVLLEKIHSEEQQMDKSINENEFFNAYQSSKKLLEYYDRILPFYHAYVSLHHVKHLKLELYLAETISELVLQSTMKTTFERVRISMGESHPLTEETRRLCEQYKLEMAMKQRQLN